MGRQVIQATVQIAEARGLKVVAVDTDAVNVVLTEDIKNHDDLQGLIAYFNDAVRERFVRADGEHIMKLMTEEVVCRFYSISRKSYLWLDLQGAEMKQWVHHS
jgi:DNA polymerase elongation subunit (family B)